MAPRDEPGQGIAARSGESKFINSKDPRWISDMFRRGENKEKRREEKRDKKVPRASSPSTGK